EQVGASKDPADLHSVEELCRFGLTEKQIEKLKDSKLAEEHTIKTIGDLVRVISKDEWWHKKIKGWGESAIEKATDAIVAYQKEFPIPDGDDRQKQCNTCETEYPQQETKCPKCGSTTFQLVDPVEPEPEGEFVQQELPDG